MFKDQLPTNYDILQIMSSKKDVTPSKIEKELRILSIDAQVPILARTTLLKVPTTKKKKSKFHQNEYHSQMIIKKGPLIKMWEIYLEIRDRNGNLPRRLEKVYADYQKSHPDTPNLNDLCDVFPPELYEAARNYEPSMNPEDKLTKIDIKAGPQTITKEVDLEYFIEQSTTRRQKVDRETNPDYEAEVAEQEEIEKKAMLKEERSERRRLMQYGNYGNNFQSSSKTEIDQDVDMDVDDFDCDNEVGELGPVSKKSKFGHVNNAYRPDMIEAFVRLVSELNLGELE